MMDPVSGRERTRSPTATCNYLLDQTTVDSHTSKVIKAAQIELDMLFKK